MNISKVLFMEKYICGVLFFALLIVFSSHSYGAVEYEYVKGKYGKKLGLIYIIGKKQFSGELAIDKANKRLLFISCDKNKVLDNEFYMRRDTRNCSLAFSTWPSMLLTHITEALGSPVVLGGPPKTCGVCIETPLSFFIIPEGVVIDPSVLTAPNDYPLEIRILMKSQEKQIEDKPQLKPHPIPEGDIDVRPGVGLPGGGHGGGF